MSATHSARDARSPTRQPSNCPSPPNPASGYSIVNAENIDAAEQLLEGCPIVDSVSFYEALPAEDPTVREDLDSLMLQQQEQYTKKFASRPGLKPLVHNDKKEIR